MAKKITEEDWKNLEKDLKSRDFRYKILNVEDGEVIIEFLDTIYETSQGEEDLIGNIWNKEWSKLEAKVLADGQPSVLSFGWKTSPLFNIFKSRCQEKNIGPDNLKGTKWSFRKINANKYEIKYIGRTDTKKLSKVDIPDKSYSEVKKVIESLKSEPELLSDGVNINDFVKAIAIRTNTKVSEIRDMIPKLVEEKVISIKNNSVFAGN